MKRVLAVVIAGCGSSHAPSTPPPPPPPPASAIAMCAGQGAPPPASTPRTGSMELQLAPAFLDAMPACSAVDASLPGALIDATAGAINAKGECAWPNGVSCHYHLGAEFVTAHVPRPQVVELHCIFPVAGDAKSPRVYGTHFTCKAGTQLDAKLVQAGAACGAGLLPQLAALAPACDARCCDDGTLTTPTAVREQTGTLDVRPDFRICAATTELDCSALGPLVGHSAYAPVFGAPVE